MSKSRGPLDAVLDVFDKILPGGKKTSGKKAGNSDEGNAAGEGQQAAAAQNAIGEGRQAAAGKSGGEAAAPAATKKKKLSEAQKFKRDLRRLITKVLGIAAITFALLFFVGGLYMCHNNYMEPAVSDGDLAIIYRLGDAYNGDVVVYEQEEQIRFGRVIGIPGDTIDIDGSGNYTINGTVPMETNYYKTYPANQSSINYPYTVTDGELFVLNDLRENVRDSRTYGGIRSVKGKVVLLIRRRGF